jgi:hypothetical protein
MTTLQHWNDVDSDFPFEREVVALTLFLSLIELYAELDKPTLSIGVTIMCYLGFRGNDRVIGRSLHALLSEVRLQPYVYCGKGVGSQGDGSAQFVAKSREDQMAAIEIIERDFGMTCLSLSLGVES